MLSFERRFQICIWKVRCCAVCTFKNVSISSWHVLTRTRHHLVTQNANAELFFVLFQYKATGARWGKITNWNPKCQSISDCFLIGNVSSYWGRMPSLCSINTHKGREGCAPFCQILEDLHNDAFFFHTTVFSELEQQCLYLLIAMEQCYT